MTIRMSPRLRDLIAREEPAVLVTVAEALGSTPREAGVRMLVTEGALEGTIGGGRLEWEAHQRARAMLASGETLAALDLPLGPAVGQCCGGRVVLRLERASEVTLSALEALEAKEERALPEVLLFGAGHVGKALARTLAPLPLRLRWIDGRAHEFPKAPPPGIETVLSAHSLDEVRAASSGAACLVLTHSHALDYEITGAALRRDDFVHVGMIGSLTKRRRFERWFTARGGDPRLLSRLVCPIGIRRVAEKRPEVIAALVAAELVLALDDAAALLAGAARHGMGEGS